MNHKQDNHGPNSFNLYKEIVIVSHAESQSIRICTNCTPYLHNRRISGKTVYSRNYSSSELGLKEKHLNLT